MVEQCQQSAQCWLLFPLCVAYSIRDETKDVKVYYWGDPVVFFRTERSQAVGLAIDRELFSRLPSKQVVEGLSHVSRSTKPSVYLAWQ